MPVGAWEVPERRDDGFDRDRRIDAFEAGLAEVCGHLHGLHARLVSMVAEALEHGWWAQAGVKTPEHWLCWQTGLGPAQARRIVTAARRRVELPVTFAAFEAGELSLDQVGPIVDRAPAWADAEVCDLARRCTVSQIRAAVGRYPFPDAGDEHTAVGGPTALGVGGHDADGSDHSRGPDGSGVAEHGGPDGSRVAEHGGPDGPDVQPLASSETTNRDDCAARHPDDPPAERRSDGEFWSFVGGEDGSWRASGRFGPDLGLLIDAALREVADALFREHGRSPSGTEVLAEMARRSLTSVADSGRRDRYRVHVLLDERRGLVDPLGHALPEWVRDLVTCDASLAVTWTRHGVPIAQGSTADTIPAATRRHVLARDGGCRIPGCGATRRLDLHHVVHRADGGTNDASNLIAICPHHHRVHHRGELGIRGDAEDPSDLEFTDAHGRPIRPNRLIRPPTGPPPEPAGSFRHPLGERLDLRWLAFEPPA